MAIILKSTAVHLKVVTPALGFILYKLAIFHVEKMVTQPAELVITSINDGSHMPGSKHYTNEAIDLRSQNFNNHQDKVLFGLSFQDYLGPKFRVLLENIDTDNEHFHIQVKKGMSF